MKKVLVIIFFINFYLGKAQKNAIVTYKAYYDIDILKKNLKKNKSFYLEKYLENKKIINDICTNIQYVLKFNNNSSYYFWDETMRNDNDSPTDFKIAVMTGIGVGTYYQNRLDSLVINNYQDIMDSQWIRETNNLYSKKWKITDETDNILGYKVIKAVKGQEVAWFTPEIPVPFGPSGVGGLPGLILKYRYKARIIYATKIKFLKKDLKIEKPTKGKLITKGEMTKKRIRQINQNMER